MTTASDALNELRRLSAAGELAANYGEVPSLLVDLSEDEMTVAARLLAKVDPKGMTGGRPVSLTVTGHSTLATLGPALVGELSRHGYAPRVRMSDYDAYLRDLLDPDSEIYREPTDITVCVLDQSVVFDEVPIPFTVADVEQALTCKITQLREVAELFRSYGTGVLIFNSIVLSRDRAHLVLDAPGRARLSAAWRRANADLLDIGSRTRSVCVLDLDLLVTTATELTDPRFATYVHAELSDTLLRRYARELAHLVRSRTGRSDKVLAVDLDGTLWGGIVGDDGIEGIEIADTPRGEAFAAFQRVILQLQSQGVMLAAISKNNADVVDEVLAEHPDQLLRAEHFVAVVANWEPKVDNLIELARQLNISTDSIVFVDDSIHEIASVCEALPEIETIHLAGEPALYPSSLLVDDWFGSVETTAEDRGRTRLYREEAQRNAELSRAHSMREFLARLEVSVHLGPIQDSARGRVSQLTLRTNQFNLTTRRLDVDDVAAYSEDPRATILTIGTADRFGDNGLVGAIFIRAVDESVHIDNMVLSCRVFGRGIEQTCLSTVLAAAKMAGFTSVTGEYLPTAKNSKVADLLPEHDFLWHDGIYVHSLDGIVTAPDHVRLIETGDLIPWTPST